MRCFATMSQRLVDAETSVFTGPPHDRTEPRIAQSNDIRMKVVTAAVWHLKIRISNTRTGVVLALLAPDAVMTPPGTR
jgi:hypothetical protein